MIDCLTCGHCWRPYPAELGFGPALCNHPKALEIYVGRPAPCAVLRAPDGVCGLEAKLFVAKEAGAAQGPA
jgi:hypothetical protein